MNNASDVSDWLADLSKRLDQLRKNLLMKRPYSAHMLAATLGGMATEIDAVRATDFADVAEVVAVPEATEVQSSAERRRRRREEPPAPEFQSQG